MFDAGNRSVTPDPLRPVLRTVSDLPNPFGCYIVPLIISILKKVGLVIFINNEPTREHIKD